MKKQIRDGRVAVLVSPGFGAGFSTWASFTSGRAKEFMVFGDENLVRFVEEELFDEAEEYVTGWFDGAEEDLPYLGGLRDLKVYWVPEGTKFVIEEYDGSENLMTLDDFDWSEA
jgi:hypothetical protein